MVKYKVCIVGLGRIAHLWEGDSLKKKYCTHMGAYSAIEEVEVVAACDILDDRLKMFRDKWGDKVRLYKDYNDMFEKERPDIASICTHAPSHKDIVLSAVKHDVKGIFCEKPMAVSLADADEMINACREKGVILSIDHTRRWDNRSVHIKELLDSGNIGAVNFVESSSTAGLMNGATHLFDLLRFYFGDVEWVFGNLIRDHSTDFSGCGIIKFKNGVLVSVDCAFRKFVLFEIRIIGNDGIIKTGGMIRGDKSSEMMLSVPSNHEQGLFELKCADDSNNAESNIPLIEAVYDLIYCIENNTSSKCSGEDGRAAVEIALAFHASDAWGKKIYLPLMNNKSVIPRETSFTKSGVM